MSQMMSKTVKIESEMVIKGGFRFCNTFLKTFGTKFNSFTYLTTTKKF